MLSNLDRYKKDLESLLVKGAELQNAIQAECLPEEYKCAYRKLLSGKGIRGEALTKKVEETIGNLPRFRDKYQSWYSEAKVLIR